VTLFFCLHFFCLRDLRVRLSASCVCSQQLSISLHPALDSRDNGDGGIIKMPQDLSKGPSSERNTGQGSQKLSFRCSDVGQGNCNWQASGNNENEVLAKVEQHAREVHHMNMDENTRSKVREAIHRQAA
jgi:predicted small metal-binding protein